MILLQMNHIIINRTLFFIITIQKGAVDATDKIIKRYSARRIRNRWPIIRYCSPKRIYFMGHQISKKSKSKQTAVFTLIRRSSGRKRLFYTDYIIGGMIEQHAKAVYAGCCTRLGISSSWNTKIKSCKWTLLSVYLHEIKTANLDNFQWVS